MVEHNDMREWHRVVIPSHIFRIAGFCMLKSRLASHKRFSTSFAVGSAVTSRPSLWCNWTARLACGSNFSQASNTPGPCSVLQNPTFELFRAVDAKFRQPLTVILPSIKLAASAIPPHFFEVLLCALVSLLLDELLHFLLLSE